MDFESDGANRYSLLLLILTVSLLCVGTLPTVTTTSSASPPPIPAGYYGEIMINGEPADVGTTVEIEINNEIRGSIDVTKSGQYGSFKAGGKRLTVTGSNAESGTATVTFYVEGDNFDRTKVQNTTPKSIVWQSQDIRQVNLSASVELNPSDSDSGSGSGGGGGSASGGGSGAPEQQGPPSIASVQSTLSLVDPTTTGSAQIQDTDSDTAGVTVAPESAEAVDSITFEAEDLSGAVEVTEYTSPPQTIKEEVAASITGAGALSEQDSADDSTSGSDNVNVMTVADISPTTEKAENMPATVTLSVPRSEVDNPQAVTVVKETYDFDAQETTWAALDTTVEETTETKITVSAHVEEFSLFAVTEADQATQQQQETDSQDEQQTDQQQDDSGPSTVVVIGGLLALLAIVSVGYFLRQN